MNLHAFYNDKYIGDVLLIRLSSQQEVTRFQRIDDLTVLYHDDDIIGYNIFSATSYVSSLQTGKVKITPKFVEDVNQLLVKADFPPVESDYDDHFVVGRVVSLEVHPDSDHMHICQVDVGKKQVQIVCGAPNVACDQYVVVAQENAVMPSGLVIVPSQLRGVSSQGMLCSARELGLENASKKRGILILNQEEYQVGEPFFK